MMRSVLSAILLAIAAFAPAQAEQIEETILVLDVSGSMWGQIDGKAKIEIARSVVSDLVDKLPAEKRLGLVAYGHREKGNCADIEEVVPVSVDRAAITTALKGLTPKGKTPVSDSVKFAAEKLKYTERRATVVLVSDGQETCEKDPCAVGRALEAAGVGLTVHIVGFGLESATESAGLRCLAEATGGRYMDANNAGDLTKALGETVAAKPVEPPKAARVYLRATDLEGGPEISEGISWVIRKPGAESVFSKDETGIASAEVPPGDYDVEAIRKSDGQKRTGKVSARAGSERTVTLAFDAALSATLKVEPAESAAAGSMISVEWTGPDRTGDYITFAEKGAGPGAYKTYVYTREGNPLSLRVPAEPGDYEVRYVLGQPTKVLASEPLKAGALTAAMTFPKEAAAGSTVAVSWTGPGYQDDWITIVDPKAPDTAYKDYFYARDNPGELKVPLEPGAYEIRYVTGGKFILARGTITVTDVTATITAPATAVAGSQIEIAYTGPDAPEDWVTVVPKGAGETAYKDYFYTGPKARPRLEMPLEPGPHEIRYVQGGRKVLAVVPIEVTPVTATIKAPARAAAGSKVALTWDGPDYPGDWVTIVKPTESASAYRDYAYTKNGKSMTLEVPAVPGSYEFRYLARGREIIARAPIEVTAP